MSDSPRHNPYLPLIFALMLVGGFIFGMHYSREGFNPRTLLGNHPNQFNKINDVLNYVEDAYVDTVNPKQLTENTIEDMLHQLDPHSAYIPAEQVSAVHESLEGNFEGIGIEFHLQDDTIMVVTVVSGGPSDQLGIQSGDRIVKIDDKNFAGVHIANDDVLKNLRGPGGTKVKVSILRRGQNHLIDFNIKRGKIPLYSVDVAYMLDAETGYIKISTFGENTYDEYLNAFMKLKGMGLKSLVLDLRGNPGGYLNTAVKIADEFLSDHKMIVYTKGRARKNEEYHATSRGFFEQGKLIVLIDEGSASASEIVSGALQDWDRATIVGRRSFGKGLVQEENSFPDGSAIRLTIARYYTPTGRCIQKSYEKGYEEYEHEVMDRVKKGELENTDSISFPDSLKFTTPGGHTVYGGGGIMPDVFVPLDTSYNSEFYSDVMADGLVIQFAYDYLDRNRIRFNKYSSFEEFDKSFSVNEEMYKHFLEYAVKGGIKKNEQQIKRSAPLIRNLIKAYIARQLYKNDGFYQVIHQMDKTLKKAMELMQSAEVSEK